MTVSTRRIGSGWRRGVVATAAAAAVVFAGCSSDKDAKVTTTTGAPTTTTKPAPTTAAPVTTAVSDKVPAIPAGVAPEPSTAELPDGIYLAQINSFDEANHTLNLNLVDINTKVNGLDGKPYLVEDLDPFTLRDLPMSDGVALFLLPDGGGRQAQPVPDQRTFFWAVANRPERPTEFDANQSSVYAITVVGQRITQVMQLFLP